MSKRVLLLSCLPFLLLAACSKTEPQKKSVEYGDAIGIEFGDATSGRFLAAVAAEKGHSPEKGVPALAGALQEASKGCPSLAKEATDQKSPPTLHLLVKGGKLEALPGEATALPSATCMTKALDGKPTTLEAPTPYELTIQLLAKKAGE
jgi:hypothetical protein